MADDLYKQFSEHEVDLIEKGLARVYRGRLVPIISGGEPDEDEDQESEENDDNESESEEEDESQEQQSFDADYVKKLRREAAASRKRAADAERKLKEKQDAELSEADRAKKERDEAKAEAEQAGKRAEEALKRAAVVAEAANANLVNPQQVFALVKDEIELDDDGEPSNVAEVLDSFVKDNPHFVRDEEEGKREASPGNPERRKKKTGGLTIEKLKTMTPKEIAALDQSEVDAVLAAA